MQKEDANQIYEALLTSGQSEVIDAQLPRGYQLASINMLQRREHRMTKKVSKYNASFNESDQSSVQKRWQQGKNMEGRSDKKIFHRVSEEMRKCQRILQQVNNHPQYYEFYGDLIDKINESRDESYHCGMEKYNKVEEMIEQGNYSVVQFWGDMKQFFEIAKEIFKSNQLQLAKAQMLENYFNEQYKAVEQSSSQDKESKQRSNKKRQKSTRVAQNDTQMTYQEKKKLGEGIRNLQPEYLRGVWEIVQQGQKLEYGEELEFDIDKLPNNTVRSLERYVFSKLEQSRSSKKKTDSSHNKYYREKSEQQIQEFDQPNQKTAESSFATDSNESQ